MEASVNDGINVNQENSVMVNGISFVSLTTEDNIKLEMFWNTELIGQVVSPKPSIVCARDRIVYTLMQRGFTHKKSEEITDAYFDATNTESEIKYHEMKSEMLCGCIMPNQPYQYFVVRGNKHGVCGRIAFEKQIVIKDDEGNPMECLILVPVTGCIAMVTGYYKAVDASFDMVEITFTAPNVNTGKAEWRSETVPFEAIKTVEAFKKHLIPKGLAVSASDIHETIAYFASCIQQNFGNEKSCFRIGSVFSVTGWKDPEFTTFVAGSRMFYHENGNTIEKECIYTDPSIEHTFDPRGSLQAWIEGVSPIMVHDRVRFVMYTAFAATILKYLHVDSFTLDICGGISGKENDKSSSGKTTMCVVSMSCFGNVNVENGSSLFNVCYGTGNFAENVLSKFQDLPAFFDESTNLPKEERENLAYRISAPVTKGRATIQTGVNQEVKAKHNIALVTGENSLLQKGRNTNIGSFVRAPQLRGGIGIDGIGKDVARAKDCCLENSGHLLKPFLHEFWIYKEYIRDNFRRSRDKYEDSTDNTLSKRQAAYFAAIEIAGLLLEKVFEKIGIEKKNAAEIVNNIWSTTIQESPIEAQWKDALIDVWQWYNMCSDKHFDGYGCKPDITETWGWLTGDKDKQPLININPLKLREFLQESGYDVDTTLESWRVNEIITAGKQNTKKDGSLGKHQTTISATRGGKSTKVVQIRSDKVCEILEVPTMPRYALKW